MNHINVLCKAVGAAVKNSIRYVAQIQTINIISVYSTLTNSLYLKNYQQSRYQLCFTMKENGKE